MLNKSRSSKLTPASYCFFCFLLLFLPSCLPQESIYKMPLTDQGEVIVYLQPMPQETDRLRFIIERIAAIGPDGSQTPLSLSMVEVKGAELLGRQRILARGIVPPGSYTGLAIQVKQAFLQTEEGEMSLLVPPEQVVAEKLFGIERQQALALFLTVNPGGTVSSGIRFTPSFSLATPASVLINLTGYVSNSAANLISVFNKKTMQVINMLATGKRPTGMALDQRRTRAYVAMSDGAAIEIFDVFTGSIIGRIRLSFGDNPIDLAITPDGRTLLSANHDSNTVSIIDALSMIEVERIKVGEGPNSVVVDPSGFKAYVMNSLSNTVSVVDLTQMTVTVTISVDGSPLRGAFDQSGNILYVITKDTPDLVVVDPAQFRVLRKIFIGPGALSLKVDFRTGLILVGKAFGGEIIVVEPSTSIFVDTIAVGGKAVFLTIDGQENTLFVLLPDKRLLQKINLTSKKIIAEIEVDAGASQVIVLGES
jgi:YVTN family beta-propeller protein